MRVGKVLLVILLCWLVLGQVGGLVLLLVKMFALVCGMTVKIGFVAGGIWIAAKLIKKTEEDDDDDD